MTHSDLTPTEQTIIEAYRKGAALSLYYDKADSIDQAFDEALRFGHVTHIWDFSKDDEQSAHIYVSRPDSHLNFSVNIK